MTRIFFFYLIYHIKIGHTRIGYAQKEYVHVFTLFSKYNPITNNIDIVFVEKDLTLYSIPTIHLILYDP